MLKKLTGLQISNTSAGVSKLFRRGGHIDDFLRLGGPNVQKNSN